LKSKVKNGVFVFVGFENGNFQRYINTSRKFKLWKSLNNIKDKRIIITSLSREETVAAFKSADLFLFPSNLECSPIVLFEAMAAGTPFLVTNVGNSIEINEWSKGGIILSTKIDNKGFSHARIKDSTKILNELYQNSTLRKHLAEEGFTAWKNKFSWEIIAKSYEALYISLVN
jgi:glycosyltransferase involved in cell wall biosynthesis